MTNITAYLPDQVNYRKPSTRTTVGGGKVIFLLSFVILLASISRFPILDQLDEVKIGVFGAEVLSFLILMVVVRRRSSAIAMMAILAILMFMRFTFAAFNANFLFQQTLAISAQESRFGIMLIACPLAYYFLKDISTVVLKKFVAAYLCMLFALDMALFTTLVSEDLLILGVRTANRFVCSVLIPLVCITLITIREKGGKWHNGFLVLLSAAMVLHTSLVTTSRIEMFFAVGVLFFIVQRCWPKSRWLLHAMLLAGAMYFVTNVHHDDQGTSGRDFLLAFETAVNGMPWGYGMVIDITAKSMLNLPDTFYFSDYGLLLYVMRYGILGIIIVFVLVLLSLKFLFACLRMRGGLFVVAPAFAYLIFIPLLDYGSLTGGFLLAFMLLVINKQYLRV